MDSTLYGSVEELKRDIETGDGDVHAKVAAALFGCGDPAQVTRQQRQVARYLNMAVLLGLSAWGAADLIREPVESVTDLLGRYHRAVVA